MWFAGLRGAIAFALSTGMPGASKDVYASTTLMVVIFTTIGCGGLTEPLLHRMNVKIQASLYMFDGDTGHHNSACASILVWYLLQEHS